MEETIITNEELVETVPVADTPIEIAEVAEIIAEATAEVALVAAVAPVADPAFKPRYNKENHRGANNKGGKGGARGGRPRAPREKPEFDSKMVSIRRVTRVVSGGRRFALSVALIAGDRNGRVGLGTGKAADTQVAIEKAMKQAKKNMIHLKLTKGKSIPHDVEEKYNSSRVMLMPNGGRGLIAGSSARVILNLAGVNDVTSKFFSCTKNKLNNARATMKALEKFAYAYGEAPVKATKMVEVPEVKVENK